MTEQLPESAELPVGRDDVAVPSEETEAAPATELPEQVGAVAEDEAAAEVGYEPATDVATAPVAASETEPVAETSAESVAEPEAEPQAPAPPEPPPPVFVRRRVTQEIARTLHAAGARFCFTVPAEPILPMLDDLAAEGIRVVTARHEGSAAFMAEALSQATGRPQIVAASRAVGAANAAIGIHTASQDSAPLVALLGQVRTTVAGREAFQEADLSASIGALAPWATQLDDANQTPAVLSKAWRRLTIGRPGPVVLSVPWDLQSEEIDVQDEPAPKPPGARGPAADRGVVSRAMKLLAASERGVIVAGGGVLRARATKRLMALSEALAVPVVAAWRRPDVFPNDHVNYLGMTGPWAAKSVKERLRDADVVLVVGARLSEATTDGYTFPGEQQRWIHVDVQPYTGGAGMDAPTQSIVADASRFLDSAWSDLRAAALDDEMRSRREARNAADREAYKASSDVSAGEWGGPGAHPGRVFKILRSALPDNAAIATDAGNLSAWVGQGYRFRRAGTFLGATSGTMGYGLPAAIASSLMDADRISVAVCGDGGFAMSLAELETSVREGAHPIAVVFDNEQYGTIALQQSAEGRSTDSSALGAIDFAAAARAHGALGFTVTDDAGFERSLREAITSRQTSVIHVKVDRAWRSVYDNPAANAT